MTVEDALRQAGISESEIKKCMDGAMTEPATPEMRCNTQQDMEYLKSRIDNSRPDNSFIWRRKKKR